MPATRRTRYLWLLILLGAALLQGSVIIQPATPYFATTVLDISKATKGGIVGGYNIATATMNLFSFGADRAEPFLADNGWFYNLSFCMSDNAVDANEQLSLQWRKYLPSGGTAGAVTDEVWTVTSPGATAQCWQNLSTVFPVFRLDYPDAFRISFGTTPATMRGWSALYLGSTAQPQGYGSSGAVTVAAATTDWITSGQTNAPAGATTETTVANTIPYAGTLSRLCILTATAQPGTGTFVLTVNDSAVPTAVTVTIPAGGAAGLYCDLTNTHVFAALDFYAISLQNNAPAAASAQISGIGWIYTPTTAGRGMLTFPHFGNVLTASADNFCQPHTRENTTCPATEPDRRAPMPIAGTLQNFSCHVDTAPAADMTVTIFHGGVAGGITGSITAAGGTGVKTIAGSQAFAQNESVSVRFTTGAGAQAVISGCAGEYVY
jgi:hypothetical protein